ncbi:MAG: SPOR domain-containing protein [Bosea sp. (in: a-proteobacteria)]|jgi:D-alanyl-D-alanine carboxypeptidase|nr:SPOR domain-containing protein [Bosea sp. (in: a-proteobacteria)]MDP3407970.1 SPOR domain-containing protein [Bosea sp. (in: a-proteobacteria)]
MIGIVAVAVAAVASPAEAARKKKRPAGGGYAPPYAAMVVDARTGRTLHAVNEDAPRIPASITKVMTLYVLFEQMERGRFNMNSELTVSAHAARQEPSKIGFAPGETITVRDAILALITKSANDVAMTVAENVGGSEDEFARMMTARARSLGMGRTTFYNPHGLPHSPPNMTTARDLTILARAIQERFPRYYPMFSTRVFNYAGGAYRNHNKLLGRIEGVDGIKTGYTRLSGFNLMTSAKADGRHVVSVVLGGRSGASRDKIMADLVVATLPRAATSGRASTLVAEAPEAEERAPERAPERIQERPRPAAPVVAAAVAEPAPLPVPRPRVETQAPLPAAARAYAPVPTTTPIAPPRPVSAGAQQLQLSGMRPVAATTTPPAMRWSIGAPAADGKILRPPANVDVTSSIAKVAEPEAAQPVKVAAVHVPPAPDAGVTTLAKVAEKAAEPARTSESRPVVATAGKWIIQLGATDDEAKARDILARARTKAAGPLADATPLTEKVEKGGTTLFRARFAGFDDSKDAERACARLKRDGFACFAARG